MTYNAVHPSNTATIRHRDGIEVIDRDSHSQTKTRQGHCRWSVMTASKDLADIWESNGRYFTKFSGNQGHEFLDDAIDEAIIATSDYTDCAVDKIISNDRHDILNAAICEQMELTVSQLNPEFDYISADSPAYEVRIGNIRFGYVYEPADGFYSLPQLCFAHTTFHSPESAAIALMEFLRPADVLLADAAARHAVADRQVIPDNV